jgi:hypothetical protein
LIFLPFTIALPQLATLSVKDRTRHAMTTFAAVQLGQDMPAIVFIIDIGQHIQRFGNAP